MRIKKIFICIAIMACMLVALTGCGGNKKGSSEITVTSDIGAVKISMDAESKYSLKSNNDTFEIVGGSETIKGSLMNVDEAESLQADSFVSVDYNVISVNGYDGFACTKDNKIIHVIPVGDGSVYVSLSVDNDAQVIYEAEESISISDVNTKSDADESVESISSDETESVTTTETSSTVDNIK